MRLDSTTASALLGVSPGADEAAIRAAYRERLRASHPDAGSPTPADLASLRTAKDVLVGDASTRRRDLLPARREQSLDAASDREPQRRAAAGLAGEHRRASFIDPGTDRYRPSGLGPRRSAYANPDLLGRAVDLFI